jgi:methyl-galactoside transport system ATP-binding protein
LKKYLKLGLLSEKKRREDTDWAIKSMNIKTASQKTQIKLLSGGNQQKVIIGRWLLTEPEILMLDEPTRGIDVGAKYEIYQLIDALAAKGKSIIVVSSELPELLGICDRIYVMSSGRIAGVVDAKKTSQEEIMTLASKYT